MGCQFSKKKDETHNNQQGDAEKITANTMANKTTNADYKSRLEWKICLVCLFQYIYIFSNILL